MSRRLPELATVLAVLSILSVTLRSEARFLEVSKRAPGTVGIVPHDEEDELLPSDRWRDARGINSSERASDLISVKLLNQFRGKELVGELDDGGQQVATVRRLPEIDRAILDPKENTIEEFVTGQPKVEPEDAQNATSVHTTTRKTRRRGRKRSTSTTSTTTTTNSPTTWPSTAVAPTTSTMHTNEDIVTTTESSPLTMRPPMIDLTRLNLAHLGDVLFTTGAPTIATIATSGVQTALRMHPRTAESPRLVRDKKDAPASATCSCRQSKRSAPRYDYDDQYDDHYDEYQDTLNELKLPDAGPGRSHLLGPSALTDVSVERAEKVQGALERLMGIVTIFSHVDDFIQQRTKKSIRRLARFYESDEQGTDPLQPELRWRDKRAQRYRTGS